MLNYGSNLLAQKIAAGVNIAGSNHSLPIVGNDSLGMEETCLIGADFHSCGHSVGIVVLGSILSDLSPISAKRLQKADINPQNTYFTFRKDGTFIRCVAGHKAEGHWMLGDKLLLGIHNVQTAEVTQHLEDGELTLVVPAGKIMGAMVSLGAIHDTTTNNAIVKLAKKLKGIEGGFTMVKKP